MRSMELSIRSKACGNPGATLSGTSLTTAVCLYVHTDYILLTISSMCQETQKEVLEIICIFGPLATANTEILFTSTSGL